MKLYREVPTNTGEPLSSLPGEMRLVLPIEITEEEIEDLANKHFTGTDIMAVAMLWDSFNDGARAILSKLKGDDK